MRPRIVWIVLGTAATILLTESCRIAETGKPLQCVDPPHARITPAETTISTGSFTPLFILVDCKDKFIHDEVSWSTEHTDVVEVDPSGSIRPVGIGEAIVVLTGTEFGRLGQVKVTVMGLVAPRDR